MRMSQRDGKETDATRYFISSLAMDVKRIAPAVRRHWSLEHTCRGCLDVTYREDESRIRAARLRENFAWLNRCSLSLLKPHSAGKSLALQRHRCSWNFDTLLKVLDAQRTECALALRESPVSVNHVTTTNPVPQKGSTLLASRRARLSSHKQVFTAIMTSTEFSNIAGSGVTAYSSRGPK